MESQINGGGLDYPSQPMPYMSSGHNTEGSQKYQLDNDEVIQKIIHSLRCEREFIDDNGNKFWGRPEGMKPYINELGLNKIMLVAAPYFDKIHSITAHDSQRIESMVVNLGNAIIHDLYLNWEAYEIKDTTTATIIRAIITDCAYSVMSRGEDATYMTYLSKTMYSNESNNRVIQAMPEQQSWLSAFTSRFKRQ